VTYTALTTLDLSGNVGGGTNLGTAGTRRLCDVLQCPRLVVLRLYCCDINDLGGADDTMRSLTAALLKFPTLTDVDLSRNHFDRGNFARIPAPVLRCCRY
jgi:hypothetical protein